MKISPEIAVQRYQSVRDEVATEFPDMWNSVIKVCEAVPAKIDAVHLWQFGRDKPCWSNIKVEIGRRCADDISKSADFSSFEIIAGDTWKMSMRQPGHQWRANKNFELQGKAVQVFINGLTRGGLSSYLWKLYAIRNLAVALASDPVVQEMVQNLAIHGQIPTASLKNWTKKFSGLVGMGWGIVTVYHMLTDLGLTPKPDVHLKRSAVSMGLLSPLIPSDYPEELFHKIDDHEIVLAVMELSKLISPTACPHKPHTALREVDKVLMEWSRQRICRSL